MKAESAIAADKASTCNAVVRADVVAFEQVYLLNRFSAYVPAGLMFALRGDVVSIDGGSDLHPGNVKLNPAKRPRPLVLRVNEGDCLEVTFTNLLSPTREEEGGLPRENDGRLPATVTAREGTAASDHLVRAQKTSVDGSRTRAASFHVTGLSVMPIAPDRCPLDTACGGDGSNVGLPGRQGVVFNPDTSAAVVDSFALGSLANPGQSVVTLWRGGTEGAYFAYSTAAPVAGEGDGGQIGHGLFAAVIVEPKGSRWYKSQVTYETLQKVKGHPPAGQHPYMAIDYEQREGSRPILRMTDESGALVHGDLNAIIVPDESSGSGPESTACLGRAFGSTCRKAFREFTVIFHDEVDAEQAFAELADDDSPMSQLKDGMGINYGVSSMGALVAAARLRPTGPARNCPECRAEEFFLSSWANGDPALILAYEKGVPVGARYLDDPSNVHNSYLGDPVRFRNIHAGPKETHVFHLHAHQWMQDDSDPNSTYLDSQTISPGATFSYGIEFGGSGNRNGTPGDSIFHCHLYPHFAQGMWELWRTHDAFVDGNRHFYHPDRPAGADNDPGWMNLPDAEIAEGTAQPAIVPLPGAALAPMPSAKFRGYPFYIPGVPGHRPPQPVLDMDVDDPTWTDPRTEPDAAKIVNGGLPRHVVTGGTLRVNLDHALDKGGEAARVIAQRVAKQDPKALKLLALEWDTLSIKTLDHIGEQDERNAMSFHEGLLKDPGHLEPADAADPRNPDWWPGRKAYRTNNAATVGIQVPKPADGLFFVNGLSRAPGAPFANPCPAGVPERDYRAAFIQTELTYNKHGWFDPQGRIAILENDIKDVIDPNNRSRLPEPLFFRANSGECINFKSSNFVPNALAVDDFQMYTPTDTIGQHIHLVKFDVTSSDGSGNGYNYEDATFSPEEVRERIFAANREAKPKGGPLLKPKAHPLFQRGGDIWEAAHGRTDDPRYGHLLDQGLCPDQGAASDDAYEDDLRLHHPYCGAQRTTQRWWADPILNTVTDKDNTLRTVFTHDHLGPSSHQQHGLYAGLVIEPANSVWTPVGQSVTVDDMAAAKVPGSLHCDLARGDAGRSAICDKLIGGSNLAEPTAAALLGIGNTIKTLEPRPPLRLRPDGGPTATMANIIAPTCIGDSDSNTTLQPPSGLNHRDRAHACDPAKLAHDTRREFALAVADFGIAYNLALEPINPEPRGDSGLRDSDAIRFGRRHVALTPARPLGISSEDPGSQYFNYRHEPLALRLSDESPDPAIGGWRYTQAARRANTAVPCVAADQDCLGDPANGFSTAVHARRDRQLAEDVDAVKATVSPMTRALLAGTPAGATLDTVLADVRTWRRNFNCALYPLLPDSVHCPTTLERREPWRVFGDPATPIFPAFEGDPVQLRLIQGAQEAQHIFTMNGVKWHRLPGSNGAPEANNSGFTNSQPLGISEHFEFDLLVNPLHASQVDYLYFGSSVDQLWDGLWGVLRSFSKPRPRQPAFDPVVTSAGPVALDPDTFLQALPAIAAVADAPSNRKDLCLADAPSRYFDVTAVRACDLYGDCGTTGRTGIAYSRRFGIEDRDALLYVLDGEGQCTSKTCDTHQSDWFARTNADTLTLLRRQFAAGRPIEPLVMRAAAGECLRVNLRNALPATLDDGPPLTPTGPGVIDERRAYPNFLPMITDGFNLNQFRMSSTVGLSAPRLAQHPLWADGSNVGLNGAVQVAPADTHYSQPGTSFDRPADSLQRQGSLVPPCAGGAVDGLEEERCKLSFVWSATDYRGVGDNVATEFGALPLRSFGDPIKHPAHGLVGALVIGPKGSHICPDDRFHREIAAGPGPAQAIPGGLSAEMCQDDKRYLDHVLMMQDSVVATRGGMPVGNLKGAEEPDDYGVKALNYKTEPLWARRGNDPSLPFQDRNDDDFSQAFTSAALFDGAGGVRCIAGIAPVLALKDPCDPETPVLDARAGEEVRLELVHPGGHTRQQGFALSGHAWNPYPWSSDSRAIEPEGGSSIRQGVYNSFGPMMGTTLVVTAGGDARLPMDYLFRSQGSFQFDGGIWGLLRVAPALAANMQAGPN